MTRPAKSHERRHGSPGNSMPARTGTRPWWRPRRCPSCAARIDPQRVLDLLRAERPRRRVRHRVVPAEADRVVVAVVRIPFPVPGQPDDVGRLFEPPPAQQLGVQPELDVLEHELGELAVQVGTDAVLDHRRVDGDGGLVAALTAWRGDQREREHRDSGTCPGHSRVHLNSPELRRASEASRAAAAGGGAQAQ